MQLNTVYFGVDSAIMSIDSAVLFVVDMHKMYSFSLLNSLSFDLELLDIIALLLDLIGDLLV